MKEDIKALINIREDLANLSCNDSIYQNDEYKKNIVKALSNINKTIRCLQIDMELEEWLQKNN